jgi:SAM-dependent methyltransferase
MNLTDTTTPSVATPVDVAAVLHHGEQAAWSLAALTLVGRGDGSPALTGAATELLVALGVLDPADGSLRGLDHATGPQVAAQAAGSLLKTAALARGDGAVWSAQSDEALRAQGEASAQGARAFAQLALPAMPDLAQRLERPGARMLDVGTGVGALAVAYAREFPRLQVLGIDVLERSLALARQTLAETPPDVAERVVVRHQDIADLVDPDGFDLVWLPAPFIPEPALRAGLTRIAAATRPGGWIMVGHGKGGEGAVADAVTHFQTVAYGGTPLDGTEAVELLHRSGFESARTVPTPPGAPGITLARRGPQP